MTAEQAPKSVSVVAIAQTEAALLSGPQRVPFSILRTLPAFRSATVFELLKRPGFPRPLEGATWSRRDVIVWLRRQRPAVAVPGPFEPDEAGTW